MKKFFPLYLVVFVLFISILMPFTVSAASYPDSYNAWIKPLIKSEYIAWTINDFVSGDYSVDALINPTMSIDPQRVDKISVSTLFGLPQYRYYFEDVTVANLSSYPVLLSNGTTFSLNAVSLYKKDFIFDDVTEEFLAYGVTYTDTVLVLVSELTDNGYVLTAFNQNGSSVVLYEDGAFLNLEYAVFKVISPLNHNSLLRLNVMQKKLTLFDRVTSGLSAVISWVGTVVTAIVSGELIALRPLVAIGIAVSALLLAWVFIRRSIWGS